MGGLIAYERFFIWDPPRRMGFCFVGTNKPAVAALGEYYEFEPLSNARTRFTWRVAYESQSAMRYISPLLRPAVRLFMGRIVKGLERYVRETKASG